MKVLKLLPGRKAEEGEIENTLDAMQEFVGGWIEAVQMPGSRGCVLVCNEEGRLQGLPNNRVIGSQMIVGPAFICGTAGEEFTDLDESEMLYYRLAYGYPYRDYTTHKMN